MDPPQSSGTVGPLSTPASTVLSQIHSTANMGNRVCDMCMVKKTKCNLKRPECSRCVESGWQCVYSAVKRKPGPSKGTVAKRRAKCESETERSSDASTPAAREKSSLSGFPCPPSPRDNSWASYKIIEIPRESAISIPGQDVDLAPQTELELMNLFFDFVQPFYPLFRKPDLFKRYENGEIPRTLLLALFSVSVGYSSSAGVIMNGNFVTCEVCAHACASHVQQEFTLERVSDSSFNLDDFKSLLLLTIFDFRNSPSRRAWVNVGYLARLAYSHGLHQIENPTNCTFYVPQVTTPAEMEEWRYLWWCIYLVDCCINVTVATPSNIEIESLRTALPLTSISSFSEGTIRTFPKKLFLDEEVENSSELIKELCSHWLSADHTLSIEVDFNIRVIANSEIREAFVVKRLMNENPGSRTLNRLALLRNKVAASRLAICPRYLNPTRNIAAGETRSQHVARLVNLLEFQVCSLAVSMAQTSAMPHQDTTWQYRWDSTMSVVEEIVSIIRNWDPRMVIHTEPEVCFIIFVAALTVHLDSKLHVRRPSQVAYEEAATSSVQLLRLFLEKLANQWRLPRFLLSAFDDFQKVACAPLNRQDIAQIIRQLAGIMKHQVPPPRRASDDSHIVLQPNPPGDEIGLPFAEWFANFNPEDLEDIWGFADPIYGH